MLRSYQLQSLEPGMVLGRDVLDSNASVLIGKGSVLTAESIASIMDRPIFSVYIEEPDQEESHIPGKEHLLDDEYVTLYNSVYDRVFHMFVDLLESQILDVNQLRLLVSKEIIPKLANGARAIGQIHNMSRGGDYLIHHSIHVAILAGLMGQWKRWPNSKQIDFVTAGLLHDVGKQLIPPDILNKHGKLTDDEFNIIRGHAQNSYDILRYTDLSSKENILQGVLQHHERCDGSGYPNHLTKENIHEFALALAVFDIYDAMAADRAYAKRRSPWDVFEILNDDMYKGKLDTEFVVYFMRNLSRALNGSWVSLSNGERGRIVYIDESRVLSLPVVQVGEDKFVDLGRDKSVKVENILMADEVN
ncbi:MAG: HD domain-containing protein [Selenomonadaceae bacterium]|nr:HD domain-containing protein [Selenomonadaceae bacterium]